MKNVIQCLHFSTEKNVIQCLHFSTDTGVRVNCARVKLFKSMRFWETGNCQKEQN